jgi:hypothetical protein
MTGGTVRLRKATEMSEQDAGDSSPIRELTTEEETAKRILDDIAPAADRWHAAQKRAWILTRDGETGALTYTLPDIGASFTLNNPEKLAASLLKWSEDSCKIVLTSDNGEVLAGTAIGNDLTPTIEGAAAGALHTCLCFLGFNLAEVVQDSFEEATAIQQYALDLRAVKKLCTVEEFTGADFEVTKKNEVLEAATAKAAQRKRARLGEVLNRAPPQDKAVERAIALMKERKGRWTFSKLAMELNERHGYELSEEALRKRFSRAQVKSEALKSGQK